VTAARARHFPPVVDAETRLLILGSLPGDASLKAAQYYAHPRNGFWPLISGVLEEDVVALPYAQRLGRLLARGVGLWDVVASAERSGSLDAAIRAPEAADLRALIRGLPALRTIGFNGGAAATLGRRILGQPTDIILIDLPSSSPAFTRPLAWKADRWAALRPGLT
jgi:double-stranded uracil-DNA glycosylase